MLVIYKDVLDYIKYTGCNSTLCLTLQCFIMQTYLLRQFNGTTSGTGAN